MSRTYGKAQDLIDFTRASGGTALRRVKYGAELVTNGTFDTDSDWIKQTGWSISSGVASFSGGGGPGLLQNAGLESGKVYAITFDITSISSGGFIARCGFDNVSQTFSTTGTHTANLVCGSNAFIYISSVGGTAGTIDNISVKEVTFDTSDGDLILFNHPNNIPRIEYDANGNLLGLLVEESRSNIVPYSEDFTQWSTEASSIIPSSGEAPSGLTAASKLIESTLTQVHACSFITNAVSASWTFSCFARPFSGNRYVQLRPYGLGLGVAYATFDLSDGSTYESGGTNLTGVSAVDYGNGWYRLSITCSAALLAGDGVYIVLSNGVAGEYKSYTGDGTSGIYIYGAQVEAGSFPTSYIPTSGSTATRSADVASIGVSEFGYNQSEGTVFVECTNPYKGSGSIIALNEGISGNSNNRIILTMDGSRTNSIFITTGGVGQVGITKGEIVGQPLTKYGASWKENDVAFVRNGGTAGTDTSATIPNVISNMDIGFYSGVGRIMTTHIKSIKYIPRRLTNDQLVEVTS